MTSTRSLISASALALAGQLSFSPASAQAPQTSTNAPVTMETVCKLWSEVQDTKTQVNADIATIRNVTNAKIIDAFTKLYEIPDPAKRMAEAAKTATAVNQDRIAERDQITIKADAQARIFQQFDDATLALAIQRTERQVPGALPNFSTLPPNRKSDMIINLIVKMNGENQTVIKSEVSHNPACAGKLAPPPPPATAVRPMQPGTAPMQSQPGFRPL